MSGIVGELSLQLLCRAIEHFDDGDGASIAVRFGAAESAHDEVQGSVCFLLAGLGLRFGCLSLRFAVLACASALDARMACHVLTTVPRTSATITSRRRDERRLVPPGEFAEPIACRGRAGLHRLVVQVVLHVAGQGAGRFVAAGAVFFQAFHDDPIEFAAEQPAQVPRVALALRADGAGRFERRES